MRPQRKVPEGKKSARERGKNIRGKYMRKEICQGEISKGKNAGGKCQRDECPDGGNVEKIFIRNVRGKMSVEGEKIVRRGKYQKVNI